MKIINFAEKLSKNTLASLRIEHTIFNLVSSDYVVKAIFSFLHETFLCIVMEYMLGGDLSSLLSHFGVFDDYAAAFYGKIPINSYTKFT